MGNSPCPLPPWAEILGGALEGGLPGGGEPLAGDGFSDWMTERVDFTALLPLEPPLPSGALPPPSPPPPDLEAMASLLKKELEQMEDFFLDAPLLPPSSPPPQPPPSAPSLPLPTFDLPQPPALDTLDLLAIYCRSEAGQGDSGLAPLPPPQQPPPPPPPPSRPAPYPNPATTRGDRKQKKRDQNKSAALRYRQRKRAEGEALEGECQGLEARNRELRERAESVEREIQYVKDLLIEVYKARSQRTRNS
uniref:Activating transcription factor 5 n=1 Tax=Ursus maritimus TaxID=29073 RepID=A0A452TN37_URSMA